MAVLLGVDVGTASTKGVAVRDGEVLARAQRPHRTSTPQPGWFEHDADAVWWADLQAVVADLLRDLGESAVRPGDVAGVAVSGIGPCLLPVDGAGEPLRPAILYGVDTRAEAQVRELTGRLGEVVIAATGSILTSQAVGPKMLWLAQHEPQVWARTRRVHMASSYLVHRLTGEYVLDHHSASQCSPLYDQERLAWHTDRWDDVAPGVERPRLAFADEVVGTVHAAAAAATGLAVGTPVTAGTVDAWAEAESAVVREPGDTMVMYGSTMFLVALTGAWRPSRRLWPTRGVRPGVSCLAAGMATSGSLTQWVADVAGADFTTLTAEAARLPAGSEGLLVLPYFAGERTPLFDARARGVVAGLTLAHGRAHLYRAALEGVALGVRHNLEVMSEDGAAPGRLVAVGGGTTGGLWTRIVSDVTGRPQQLPRETVGASYGDAMLAAVATGTADAAQTAAWNPTVEVVEPDEASAARYDALYRDYRALYEGTRDVVHRLADR